MILTILYEGGILPPSIQAVKDAQLELVEVDGMANDPRVATWAKEVLHFKLAHAERKAEDRENYVQWRNAQPFYIRYLPPVGKLKEIKENKFAAFERAATAKELTEEAIDVLLKRRNEMLLALSHDDLLEAEGFRLDMMMISQGVKDLDMMGRTKKGGKRTKTMDKIRIKTALEEFDIQWPAITKVALEMAPDGFIWDAKKKGYFSPAKGGGKANKKAKREEIGDAVSLKDMLNIFEKAGGLGEEEKPKGPGFLRKIKHQLFSLVGMGFLKKTAEESLVEEIMTRIAQDIKHEEAILDSIESLPKAKQSLRLMECR